MVKCACLTTHHSHSRAEVEEAGPMATNLMAAKILVGEVLNKIVSLMLVLVQAGAVAAVPGSFGMILMDVIDKVAQVAQTVAMAVYTSESTRWWAYELLHCKGRGY